MLEYLLSCSFLKILVLEIFYAPDIPVLSWKGIEYLFLMSTKGVPYVWESSVYSYLCTPVLIILPVISCPYKFTEFLREKASQCFSG